MTETTQQTERYDGRILRGNVDVRIFQEGDEVRFIDPAQRPIKKTFYRIDKEKQRAFFLGVFTNGDIGVYNGHIREGLINFTNGLAFMNYSDKELLIF